jgi:hypothetical protein
MLNKKKTDEVGRQALKIITPPEAPGEVKKLTEN